MKHATKIDRISCLIQQPWLLLFGMFLYTIHDYIGAYWQQLVIVVIVTVIVLYKLFLARFAHNYTHLRLRVLFSFEIIRDVVQSRAKWKWKRMSNTIRYIRCLGYLATIIKMHQTEWYHLSWLLQHVQSKNRDMLQHFPLGKLPSIRK